MKIVLALLVIAVCYANAELTEKQLKKLRPLFEECKEPSGVTKDDILVLKQHKTPETQTGKCFIACMKKKIGLMDADNKLNVEGATKLLEKIKEKDAEKAEALTKVINTCAAEVPGGDDECEVAAKLTDCSRREIEAAGIKVSLTDLYTDSDK